MMVGGRMGGQSPYTSCSQVIAADGSATLDGVTIPSADSGLYVLPANGGGDSVKLPCRCPAATLPLLPSAPMPQRVQVNRSLARPVFWGCMHASKQPTQQTCWQQQVPT